MAKNIKIQFDDVNYSPNLNGLYTLPWIEAYWWLETEFFMFGASLNISPEEDFLGVYVVDSATFQMVFSCETISPYDGQTGNNDDEEINGIVTIISGFSESEELVGNISCYSENWLW